MPESARRRLGVDSTGLVVGDVEPGRPAAESGIRPGDVIVAVNNRAVAQPSDWPKNGQRRAGRTGPSWCASTATASRSFSRSPEEVRGGSDCL